MRGEISQSLLIMVVGIFLFVKSATNTREAVLCISLKLIHTSEGIY